MKKNAKQQTSNKSIKYCEPKTQNQKEFIRSILENEITIAYGPAGCGKTHIAIALAIQYLLQNRVEQIVLTRPVLESGEKLGALPGDVSEKISPYLTPLYDEIHKYISHSDFVSMMNSTTGGIKIAPLAYMRGRTFNNSFIILDEAQNATFEQMKMFLTRIGQNSKMVITGDIEQTDLPESKAGALENCIKKLDGIDGLALVELDPSDVVRNSIISKILRRLNE